MIVTLHMVIDMDKHLSSGLCPSTTKFIFNETVQGHRNVIYINI